MGNAQARDRHVGHGTKVRAHGRIPPIEMWHSFITLPLPARVIALLGTGGLAFYAFLKHKAITTAFGAIKTAAADRFWGHVRKQVQAGAPPAAPPAARPVNHNERTYRGSFRGYNQFSAPPRQYFFELVHEGTLLTVPVVPTNLLTGIQHGENVEVDTQVGIYLGRELVLRVRVVGAKLE